MNVRTFLAAGGNPTALIWDAPTTQRTKLAKQHLSQAEQVGFVETQNIPTLTMMGGELCINGLLSLASTLGKKGTIATSAMTEPIPYENTDTQTAILLQNFVYQIKDKLVLLSGIGFIVMKPNEAISKAELKAHAAKHNLPAFGAIYIQDDTITPHIFVEQTDTLITETACGSGSIATHLITGKNKIIQPTGEAITIEKIGTGLRISAHITEITH
jgi:diaminopimelate epimerase